jgi:PAS domain S-box-containing protein
VHWDISKLSPRHVYGIKVTTTVSSSAARLLSASRFHTRLRLAITFIAALIFVTYLVFIMSFNERLHALDEAVWQAAIVYATLGLVVLIAALGLIYAMLVRPIVRQMATQYQALESQVQQSTHNEQTLRQSQHTFRLLARSLPSTAFFMFDHDLRYTLAEGALLQLANTDSATLAGSQLHESCPPELLSRVKPLFEKALQGEQNTLNITFRERNLIVNFLPVRDSETIVGGLVMVQDKTDQMRSDHLIVEQAMMIEQISAAAPDIIYVYDFVHRRNVYSNREIIQALGYTPDQLAGFDNELMTQILHPDDMAKVAEHHRKVGDAGQSAVTEIEYRMKHADGEWRWLRSRDTLFKRTQDGTPWQIIGIARDVTEQKLIDARLMELKVQQERVHLMNDFVRDMSHDFRTPITIINTSTYLIKKLAQVEQVKERAIIIEQQSARLNKLMDQLLLVSRLNVDSEIKLAPTHPSMLIQRLRSMYQERALACEIELVTQSPTELPPIQADASYLLDACSEVMDNALRYALAGGKVTLKIESKDAKLRISVQDTGEGIAENDMPHIFEAFYRADKARNTEGFGAGMGLTIAKRIVELHGGHIYAENAPSGGAIFYIELPLNADTAQP